MSKSSKETEVGKSISRYSAKPGRPPKEDGEKVRAGYYRLTPENKQFMEIMAKSSGMTQAALMNAIINYYRSVPEVAGIYNRKLNEREECHLPTTYDKED